MPGDSEEKEQPTEPTDCRDSPVRCIHSPCLCPETTLLLSFNSFLHSHDQEFNGVSIQSCNCQQNYPQSGAVLILRVNPSVSIREVFSKFNN